ERRRGPQTGRFGVETVARRTAPLLVCDDAKCPIDRVMVAVQQTNSSVLGLKINSDPANLASVRRALEDFCAARGFDPKSTADVGLCANEAIANVMRHAYRGEKDRPIEVSACEVDGSLEVTIRDWGSGLVPPPAPGVAKDPLTPGGLGLICMEKLMSEV